MYFLLFIPATTTEILSSTISIVQDVPETEEIVTEETIEQYDKGMEEFETTYDDGSNDTVAIPPNEGGKIWIKNAIEINAFFKAVASEIKICC
jgi:hypothetical protein